jgi:hypothetical protein
VVEVDPVRHQIAYRMALPLGIVSNNRIACVPADAGSCVVRFG